MNEPRTIQCPECRGMGDCPTCDGTGKVEAARTLIEALTPGPWPDCEVCRERHVREGHRLSARATATPEAC